MSRSLEIDDTDPNIVYLPRGSWETGGGDGEFNRTTVVARIKGATAQIAFIGTRIEVFGTLAPFTSDRVDPSSVYMVDNDPSTMKRFSGRRASDGAQYKISFYQWENLAPGTHSLLIKNDEENDELWLDYFRVIGDEVGVTALTPAMTASASQTRTSSSSSATVTVSGTSETGTAKKTSVGAIAGGAVGGLFVICLIILGVFFLVSRKKKRAEKERMGRSSALMNETYMDQVTPGASQVPFLPTPGHQDTQVHAWAQYVAPATHSPPSSTGSGPFPYSASHGTASVYPDNSAAQNQGYQGSGSQVHLMPSASGQAESVTSVTSSGPPMSAKAREAARMRVVQEEVAADPPPLYEVESMQGHARPSP